MENGRTPTLACIYPDTPIYLVAGGKVDRVERDSVWIGDRELPVGPGYAQEIGKITGKR